MVKAVLLFIVGLLFLIKGGDWFVDGAVGVARRLKLPEILIGATVVSIGTTLPEVSFLLLPRWSVCRRWLTVMPLDLLFVTQH